MKKNIFLILFIFVLLCPSKVGAEKISADAMEVECIYDNGVVITAYYDGAYALTSADMKLSNSISPPYSTALTYFYKEAEFAKMIVDSGKCPAKIGYMVVKQTDASDNTVTFQLYFRADNDTVNDTTYVQCCKSNNSNYDEAFFKSQIVPGFEATSGIYQAFTISRDSMLWNRSSLYVTGSEEKKVSFKFNLVAERIYFNEYVTPNKQWAFKSEGTQAASNPTYIRVYEYTAPGGNTLYVSEKGNTITRMTNSSITEHDDSKTMFACFKPSVKEIDSDKTDMAYKFTSIRHALTIKGSKKNEEVVEGTNGYSCGTGYSLYREVNWSEVPEDADEATSICDVIPETSLLIAKIINYARILVPIFLIILTAVDITKIILTGNIDEELPKRRKLIIIRFVVAVVFFFLPIFIQIFVSSSYGIDFGDISCLW